MNDGGKSDKPIVPEKGANKGVGGIHAWRSAWGKGLLENGLKVRPMCLPDRFIDHDTPKKQYDEAGLNASHIVATALAALGRDVAARPARA